VLAGGVGDGDPGGYRLIGGGPKHSVQCGYRAGVEDGCA
jgi:hypothetical protein